MPRKFDITEMKAKLAKYDERKRDTEKALSKIESSRKELVAKIAAEERKERTIFARLADWFTSISARILRVNNLRQFLTYCSR